MLSVSSSLYYYTKSTKMLKKKKPDRNRRFRAQETKLKYASVREAGEIKRFFFASLDYYLALKREDSDEERQ